MWKEGYVVVRSDGGTGNEEFWRLWRERVLWGRGTYLKPPALLLSTEWPGFWSLAWGNKRRAAARDIAAKHGLIWGIT